MGLIRIPEERNRVSLCQEQIATKTVTLRDGREITFCHIWFFHERYNHRLWNNGAPLTLVLLSQARSS